MKKAYRFENTKTGSEKYYILIPRADVERLENYPVDSCLNIILKDNQEISFEANLSWLFFEFSSSLEPLRVRSSYGFETLYAKALRDGKTRAGLDESYFENLKKKILYWDGEAKVWTAKSAMSNKW